MIPEHMDKCDKSWKFDICLVYALLKFDPVVGFLFKSFAMNYNTFGDLTCNSW